MWIWTIVENCLAIMCACGPALKPLYTNYIALTVHKVYSYAHSKHTEFTPKSTRLTNRQSYASRKEFNLSQSQQSHLSVSHITSIGDPDGKNLEMKIIVMSDIEQAEEKKSGDSVTDDQV
jgi:hypothetical protein